MKRMFRVLLVGIAIGPLGLEGCDGFGIDSSSSSPGPAATLTFTDANVTVSAPAGVDTTGWLVQTGAVSSSPLAGLTTTIHVLDNQTQLIWVADAQGNLALAAIKEPGVTNVTADSTTTAVALSLLHPFTVADYLADPAGVKTQIGALPQVQALAALVDSKLSQGISPLLGDAGIQSAVHDAVDAVIELLHPNGLPFATVTPAGEQSGITVTKTGLANGQITVKVANARKRLVVEAYLESGTTTLESKMIPPLSDVSFTYDITQNPNAQVKIYMPGKVIPTDWPSEPYKDRVNRPLALTAIAQMVRVARITLGVADAFTGDVPGSARDQLRQFVESQTSPSAWTALQSGNAAEAVEQADATIWQALIGQTSAVLATATQEMIAGGITAVSQAQWEKVNQGVALMAAFTQKMKDYCDQVMEMSATLLRVTFDVINAPPAVQLTADQSSGTPPFPVTFTVTSDYDLASYQWDFGDGTTGPLTTVSGLTFNTQHTYTSEGTFTATVTVKDIDGAEATKQFTVTGAQINAPSGLTATATGGTTISLAWTDNATNETGFKIERGTDGTNFSQIATVGADVTSYGDTVSEGTLYYYRVRATSASGNSSYSNTASAIGLGAPSGLSATPSGMTAIDLAWSDNSSSETGFTIERSTDGATFSALATVGANVTTYQDGGLIEGNTYYYRVFATGSWGTTGTSNVASATLIGAPSGLTATAVECMEVVLTWTDNSGVETGFKIERGVSPSSFSEIATVAANTTTYADEQIPSAGTYYYRVRASTASGNSAYSNDVSADVVAPGSSVPNAPANLQATAVSARVVRLSWTDNSEIETGFSLERSTDGASWVPAGDFGGGANGPWNSDLVPSANTTYYYRVKASNYDGTNWVYSSWSNVVSVTTPSLSFDVLPAPTLTVEVAGPNLVYLLWTDAFPMDGYYIERKDPGFSSFTKFDDVRGHIRMYADVNGLDPSATYTYRVRAYYYWGADKNTISTSNEVTITTGATNALDFSTAVSGRSLAWSGSAHSLSLRTDGTVWMWGEFGSGPWGNGVSIYGWLLPQRIRLDASIQAISAGGGHALGLTAAGTVYAWGNNGYGQLGNFSANWRKDQVTAVTVAGLSGITSVSAGEDFSLALKSDGTVWAWGLNNQGQLGIGNLCNKMVPRKVTGLTGVTAIAAGARHALARKSDGTVWIWGYSTYGIDYGSTPVQLAGISDVVTIAAGRGQDLFIKTDGTVWGVGYYFGSTPSQAANITNAASVACGYQHSIALDSSGQVWTWGDNTYGQLGDGSTSESVDPIQVPSMSGCTSVSASSYSSYAVKSDGTIYSWGGELLGRTAPASSTTPVQVGQ